MNKKLFPLYFLLIVVAFMSCNEMDDVTPVTPANNYLVDAEFQSRISKTVIDLTIAAASADYEDLAEIKDHIQTGVEVYKISYKTTFNGNPVVASGIVALPDVAGQYAVLSYQNGTNTEHSKAPSVDSENQLFNMLKMMSSTGFIIALPDYLGFGEADDMFHPYLHRQSTVQTVTDMLAAVREFIDQKEDISLNNDLYLAGYSQGGWATMQVQQAIEANTAFSYHLKASACSAGPYNLVTLNEYIVGLAEYPQPYFLAYIFSSYLKLGGEIPVNTIFQEPYADKIENMFDGQTSGEKLNAALTTTVSDLFTPEYLSGWNTETTYAPVFEMLQENSVPDFVPTVPTKLFYGTADTYVPPLVSEKKYDEFIAAGASTSLVRKVPLDGLNHVEGIFPSGLASILWFLEMKN